MYVQHMVDAVEGVDPDLLQYIYEAWTSDLAYNMVTLMSFYGDFIGNSMGSFMGFPGIYLLVMTNSLAGKSSCLSSVHQRTKTINR